MKKVGFNIRFIAKNVNVLNILLLFVVIILLAYFSFPALKINIANNLAIRKNKPKLNTGIISSPKLNLQSLQDYAIIANNNVFHPERIIPPEKKEEEKPLPKPDFVLHGTLISDTVKIAYLEDLKEPRYTPSRGKRISSLMKDDVMSGFTLKEIDADRVVLVRGG